MIDIIAHRGNIRVAPDNSVSAVKECLKIGVNVIELDVALTKDNVPIIFHEDYIDNLTSGKGLLKDWTYSDLKTLSLDYKSKFGNKYKDEKIISLSELLEYIKSLDVYIILDFHPNDDIYPVIEVLKDFFEYNNYENKMTLMVRNFNNGKVLKLYFPNYKVYLTCPRKSDDKHHDENDLETVFANYTINNIEEYINKIVNMGFSGLIVSGNGWFALKEEERNIFLDLCYKNKLDFIICVNAKNIKTVLNYNTNEKQMVKGIVADDLSLALLVLKKYSFKIIYQYFCLHYLVKIKKVLKR